MPLAALLYLALAGCGGGGGGSDPGPPPATITGNVLAPSTGPGDTQGYFPNGVNDEWYYNATTDDTTALAPTSLATLSLGQQLVVHGQNAQAYTLMDTAKPVGTDSYYVFSPGGISFVGNNDATDVITSLIVPYATLLFPVQPGTVSSVHGTNLAAGSSGGKPVTADVIQTIQNIGVETVVVPAGTFNNAMRQDTTGSVTLRSATKTATGSGTDSSWIVPGVGVVKETATSTAGAITIHETHELRGYVVSHVRHGIGARQSIRSEVAPNPGSGLPRSAVAIGTNGTTFAIAYPQVTGTASNYQITWTAQELTRLGQGGVFQALAPAAPYSSMQERAAVASDGTNYLFAVQRSNGSQQSTIMVARWVPASMTLSPLTTVTPAFAQWPSLAFDGTNYLLVYSVVLAPEDCQLFGQLISSTTGLAVGAAVPLTPLGGGRYQPSVAFDGMNYLVAWMDSATVPANGRSPGVYAERVSPSGTIVDTTPIAIATQSVVNGAYGPVVAFDGANYLVAYPDNRVTPQGELATISAARVSPAGALLDGTVDTPGIAVSTAAGTVNRNLSLAFIAGEYWLAWESAQDSGTIVPDGLYVARISAAGTVLSPRGAGFRLAPAGTDAAPVLAGDAAGGFALWWATVPASGDTLAGATVNAVGP